MTTRELIYTNDQFLNVFKSRFNEDYLDLYLQENIDEIVCLFSNTENIVRTGIEFKYVPLKFESKDLSVTLENIKSVHESLGFLTATEAAQEKLWLALLNSYYIEYHMDQISMINRNLERSIRSRTIFTDSRKRSLFLNNLSVLWWIGYYIYDEEAEDPYHLIRFYVDGSYRGNTVSYLSSNIVSNKKIVLGSLEAIRDLIKKEVIRETRYAYTETNKLLNQIGGVSLIDALSREEIYNLVIRELPKMSKVSLV